MNVLIVEDNENMRKMLRCTFEYYKCKTIEAKDGQEGLELARRHKPDLIISDALMPRMDGFQFLRALKSDPGLKYIPFIFYSAIYDGDQEEKLAFSLGAEAFIDKPTEPGALWEKTCAVMNAHRVGTAVHSPLSMESGDEQYLSEYSQVVATKLEEKVQELEEALILRREAEDRLQRLNAELELRVSMEVEKSIAQDRIIAHQARLAAMGEMMGNVAHQWRQPLNNVALLVQSMLSEYESNNLTVSSCRESVAVCMKALTYMSSTIDKFRAFYLPDQVRRLFNPYEAVAETIPLIRDNMESHGIGFRVVNENCSSVYGYQKAFSQVIMNIIINAKDAVLKRGPSAPFVSVICKQKDSSTVVVSICDNGGGIPPEIHDKIFDPYFSTRFMSQGVGMGLYMSKMIVEKHMGGKIEIHNIDDGAVVTIEIPVQCMEMNSTSS